MATEDRGWVRDVCLEWKGDDPADLLERLMGDCRCATFGPVHHYLVGAALLTCAWDGSGGRDFGHVLDELSERASCVPGASCAKWGVCGAAASCGMAFALLAGNSPLRPEGWSEGQLMVADILRGIAEAGAPRCCKRDSRIAVAIAVPWFNGHLGTHMTTGEETPACGVSGANSACLGRACPYFVEQG